MLHSTNADVSNCPIHSEPSSNPQSKIQHSVEEPKIGNVRLIQRKVVYYSDFELNIEEWIFEHDCAKIYSTNLKKELGKLYLNFRR